MKNKIIWAVIIVAVVGGIIWLSRTPGKAGAYDEFATCIKDSGAQFYGTFWCPHCQNQKAKFGKSAKLLPYIECSTADGRGQLEICREAGIEGYPTWVFADGSRESGELSLEYLSEKTSCPLNGASVE